MRPFSKKKKISSIRNGRKKRQSSTKGDNGNCSQYLRMVCIQEHCENWERPIVEEKEE